MHPKRYIVWSKDNLDLQDPFQREWHLTQVLLHGRADDVAAIDWNEVRTLLPKLQLPAYVRSLWESYFSAQR